MRSVLEGPGLSYSCRIFDIRDISTAELLASPHLEDNILAVLTRLADSRETIRSILQRINAASTDQRATLIAELLLLVGLRQLRVIMERAIEQMSVLIDINRHTIFGPIHREGVKEGIEKGQQKGASDLVLRLLARRFGELPPSAVRRIRTMNADELDTLTARLFEVTSLKDLFA